MPGTSTDTTPLEMPEIEGEPTPSASSGSSGGGGNSGGSGEGNPSVDELVSKLSTALLPQLREALRPDIERGIQSSKDVRFKRIEGLDPDDIRIVADALKKAGDDPVAAAEALGMQALLAERRSRGTETAPAPQAGPASQTVVGATREEQAKAVLNVLSSSNLTEDQQKELMAEWKLTGPYPSFDGALVGLNTLIVSRYAGGSPPSAAAGAPGGGKPPVDSGDKTELVDRLYSELSELQREPTKNRAEMKAVKERLKELGEPI